MAFWNGNEEASKAYKLKRSVRMQEFEQHSDYEEQEVRQAIVHAREDIVMLVSYNDSLMDILKSTRVILLLILISVSWDYIHFWFNYFF